MKKIKDERLILQNLKNIRIAYIVQTVGMVGILLYEFIMGGLERMTANPVWLVLLLSSITILFLNMNIAVAYESENKSAKKSLVISVIVIFLVAIIFGRLLSLSEGYGLIGGLVTGVIIVVSGLIPTIYIYKLRLKNKSD